MTAAKVHWRLLLGCCLALWIAGCAPPIYETPYVPPPAPKPQPPPVVSRQVFYVAVNRLNLRGCAGMDCPKISMLELNDEVEKLGELDDWFEVFVKRDGRRGWVSSRHLSPEPVTAAPEAPPSPAPPPEAAPTPPPLETPHPLKPPVVEKPKPVAPGEAPPAPKKKPEEGKPAKPAKPGEGAEPGKPKPPVEKPAPPPEKPAPVEKPAPPKEPEPEQPKKIRIM